MGGRGSSTTTKTFNDDIDYSQGNSFRVVAIRGAKETSDYKYSLYFNKTFLDRYRTKEEAEDAKKGNEAGVQMYNLARNEIVRNKKNYSKYSKMLIENGYQRGISNHDFEAFVKGNDKKIIVSKSAIKKIDSMFLRKGILDKNASEATLFGNLSNYKGGAYIEYILKNKKQTVYVDEIKK